MTLVGVDGCRSGWICLIETAGRIDTHCARDFGEVLTLAPDEGIIAIDVPIGLTDMGPRAADLAARKLLGRPRGSSVFPAPVRATLGAQSYADACALHEQADGRRMSRQAFGILPKIRDVDDVVGAQPRLQERVREVHPEVCFAVWNGGLAMRYRKARPSGRAEREALIESVWPGCRQMVWPRVRGLAAADDLNDAFAALWTARRIRDGSAIRLPADPPTDARGLRMEIVA